MTGPIPWWELPVVLAAVFAVALAVTGVLSTLMAADWINRLTVDRPPSGDAAASPGEGRWAVGRQGTPATEPFDGPTQS